MKKWLKYHSWLKLTFTLVFGGIVAISYFWPKPEVETVHGFAAVLRNMIVEERRADFRVLPCFPQDCISDAQTEYVFGQGSDVSVIRTLLTKPGIRTKVYGPLSEPESAEAETYVILYYDPVQVTFDQYDRLTVNEREALWWKGYVETRVARKDEAWGFFETPFYYGAHLPFVDDYG